MDKERKRLSYKDSGVDVSAGDEFASKIQSYLRQTYGPNVIDYPGGFAGLYLLKADAMPEGPDQPVLVASTDGVGTKLKIAFMMDKHDTVGIDLVAMSVNDLLCVGALPMFFLDYMATGKLRQEVMLAVVKGISEGCKQSNCALLGGETAEMPGFYSPGEYDLAGFAVGMAKMNGLVNGSDAQPGDHIIGLASSGIHSNGYSLVRKLFFEQENWSVERHVDELGTTLGEEILKPTRIYVSAIREILQPYENGAKIRGIANITGGGFPGNIPRALPKNCGGRIKLGSWQIPPIFSLMQQLGDIEDAEMYRTFNMGIGMVLMAPPEISDAVLNRLQKVDYAASIIGEVVEGEHKLTIE